MNVRSSNPLKSTLDALALRLEEAFPTQIPFTFTYPPWVITLAGTLAITYLVHYEDTKPYRVALWPIAFGSAWWALLTIDLGGWRPMAINIVTAIVHSMTCSTRWAFADDPPAYHPLPRRPPLDFIRRTTAFKSLDLFLNEFRLLSIAPYSPPLKRSAYGWFPHLLYHTAMFVFHLIVFDLSTYPLFHLDPEGLGYPFGRTTDYDAGVDALARRFGVSRAVVRAGLTFNVGWGCYAAMAINAHLFATMGMVTGLWCGEEWPGTMNKPFLATSLSEFWGRRYHQRLRHWLLLVTSPFRQFPSYILVPLIFLASGVYHVLLHYPFHHHLALYPCLTMFLGAGLGNVVERLFLKATGRRVGGWYGRIWTWTWLAIVSQPLVRSWYELNIIGQYRWDLSEDPTGSVAHWLAYASGIAPRPVKP